MFDIITAWCNRVLFSWFDSSNAAHIVLLTLITSIMGAIIIPVIAWPFLKCWGFARRVAIDENLRTRRYLKSLERRARMSIYWKSASIAQRIHFAVLRVVLALCGAATVLAFQGFLAFGLIINASQEDAPKNIGAIINATKQAADGNGIGIALIQQQYVFQTMLLLCIAAILFLFLTMSVVIYTLKTIRLAELDDVRQLLQAINSIRASLELPRLSEDSPVLKTPSSLLFPS